MSHAETLNTCNVFTDAASNDKPDFIANDEPWFQEELTLQGKMNCHENLSDEVPGAENEGEVVAEGLNDKTNASLDEWYTTLELVDYLKGEGTLICCTIRKSRSGLLQ